MKTIRFTAKQVSKKNPNQIYIKSRDFPIPHFMLRSPTGKSVMMTFDSEATSDAYMQNEGWDGEYMCAHYHGSVNGKRITAELGDSPYDD